MKNVLFCALLLTSGAVIGSNKFKEVAEAAHNVSLHKVLDGLFNDMSEASKKDLMFQSTELAEDINVTIPTKFEISGNDFFVIAPFVLDGGKTTCKPVITSIGRDSRNASETRVSIDCVTVLKVSEFAAEMTKRALAPK